MATKSKRTARKAPWNSWASQVKRNKRYPLHMGVRYMDVGKTTTLCVLPIRPNEVLLPSYFKWKFVCEDEQDAEDMRVVRVVAMQVNASVYSNFEDPAHDDAGGVETDTGLSVLGGGPGQVKDELQATVDDPVNVDKVNSKIIEGYNYDGNKASSDASTTSTPMTDLWKQPLLKRRKTMDKLGIKVLRNSVIPLDPMYNEDADHVRLFTGGSWKISSPQGKGRFYTQNVLSYIVFCVTGFDLDTNIEFGVQMITHPQHLLPPAMKDARYNIYGGYGGGDVSDSSAIWDKLKLLYSHGDHIIESGRTGDAKGVAQLIARPKIATDLPSFNN